jgi:hypothetical protein
MVEAWKTFTIFFYLFSNNLLLWQIYFTINRKGVVRMKKYNFKVKKELNQYEKVTVLAQNKQMAKMIVKNIVKVAK